MSDRNAAVLRHYQRQDGALERVRRALEASGLAFGTAGVADLAPLDQFHTRGLKATRELAGLAGVRHGCAVIDVGCGIGGPARYLADAHGCRVTGVDLSPALIDIAGLLSRWSGLTERTDFRQGDALALAFPGASFDLAWTFQAQMNIKDKVGFYGECFRVLRPGGRLAFQDIFLGDGRPLDFPVPWASDASISHLVAPQQARKLLREAGFAEVAWVDQREVFERDPPPALAPGEAPPALGLQVVFGEEYLTVRRPNSARAFREGRIEFYQGVFEKPS